MNDIRNWNAGPEWEPIDRDRDAAQWLWHGTAGCSTTDLMDPAIDGPHQYDDGTGNCTSPDHEAVVSIATITDVLVGFYIDSSLCFTMSSATAQFLVERMAPDAALEWTRANAVVRNWGMPYRIDLKAETRLLGV